MVEPEQIRRRSLETAEKLGYQLEESLPLLDAEVELRAAEPVVERLLAMHVTVACAFGFDRRKATAWLEFEGLGEVLTEPERRFMESPEEDGKRLVTRVEGVWALAWALQIFSGFGFEKPADRNLVALLPDLRRGQDSSAFRQRASLRSPGEILEGLDLAYCLHWGLREARQRGRGVPGRVQPYVVVERHRALEWLVEDEDWEEIPLDI